MDGVLVLDKPGGITSHDAVMRVRRILGIKRIGHLGTLDPMAIGVLPLVVGRATRLAQFFLEREKVYEGTMRLGFATDTYDRMGKPLGPDQPVDIACEAVQDAFDALSGAYDQVPPPVSAKKVGGVEAYKLARRNQAVVLTAVPVQVSEFSVTSDDPPYFGFRIRCSAGTYVRSLVHEAGERLGCGAHVHELRRLASGEFALADAVTLDRLLQLQAEGRAAEALVPASRLLPEYPPYTLPAGLVAAVLHGRDFQTYPPVFSPRIKVLGPDGQLLAIADRSTAGFYHPGIVL